MTRSCGHGGSYFGPDERRVLLDRLVAAARGSGRAVPRSLDGVLRAGRAASRARRELQCWLVTCVIPTRFISFMPWESLDAIQAWKAHDEFKQRMSGVQEFVDKFAPTETEVVARARRTA